MKNLAETLTPDICVIGGGSAGLSVAAAAAAFGVPTVLIEKNKMGGDCLNTGCVPSKALLAAARRAALMQNSGSFGMTAPGVTIDFAKVHDHVHGVISAIAPNDSRERFAGLGVIPAAFVYALAGTGLDSVITAQKNAHNDCLAAGRADCHLTFDASDILTPQLLGALVALGLLALVPVVVKRLRARRRASL